MEKTDSLALTNACQGCKQRDDLNRVLSEGIDLLSKEACDCSGCKKRELIAATLASALAKQLVESHIVPGITSIDEATKIKRKPKSIIKTPLGRTRAERKANFLKLSRDAG